MDALWWHMKQMSNIVSLYHFHHVWCACRSHEELTDSNVSCRVTSRPKHFLISLQISFVIGLLHLLLYIFILPSFVKCVYIYFPLPLPNLPVFTFFSYLATFFEKFRLFFWVVLEIFWGRVLATLIFAAFFLWLISASSSASRSISGLKYCALKHSNTNSPNVTS